MQDKDYIAGIRSGDRQALKTLHDLMLPKIARLANSLGMRREDARDVFQDGVLIVFEKAGQPGFTLTSSFTTYFYGICHNLLGNLLKKKSGREVTIPEDAKYRDDGMPDVQQQMEAAERHRLFHRAFQQLGDDCRTLLSLSFEDRKPEDIMARIGIESPDYFRRRKYLCKEKLVQLVRRDAHFAELSTNFILLQDT